MISKNTISHTPCTMKMLCIIVSGINHNKFNQVRDCDKILGHSRLSVSIVNVIFTFTFAEVRHHTFFFFEMMYEFRIILIQGFAQKIWSL